MCGASLVEEGEEKQEVEESGRGWPAWVSSAVVLLLTVIILAVGAFSLYALLTTEPSAEELTPTVSPTWTPTATPSATPTQTHTPTSTPTPIPPRAHEVEEGETLSDIAAFYNLSVEEILALNPEVEPDLIRADDVLLIPAATPTPGATSTPDPDNPTPTPGDFVVHVVKSGETLLGIAEQYHVSVDLIRTANDLSADEETIQAEQSLIIPNEKAAPTPTPTANPNATPTPIPPYEAPTLLNPPNGIRIANAEDPVLQWASVSVLRDDEWYQLTISQPDAGIISDTIRTRATAWRIPDELLEKATGQVNEISWQVQIVRETLEDGEVVYKEAGEASEIRTFSWPKAITPASSSTSESE
jgi:LysM repeat protein